MGSILPDPGCTVPSGDRSEQVLTRRTRWEGGGPSGPPRNQGSRANPPSNSHGMLQDTNPWDHRADGLVTVMSQRFLPTTPACPSSTRVR